MPRLLISEMYQQLHHKEQQEQQQQQQQQEQLTPDTTTTQLPSPMKRRSPGSSFVDKIVSKVTTGVLPMLARMSGQSGGGSSNSALMSTTNSGVNSTRNSKPTSTQSSAANSVRRSEPNSTSTSVQNSAHGMGSVLSEPLLLPLHALSMLDGEAVVTPDESSRKPRSGMVSRSSLSHLSSLSSVSPQLEAGGGGLGYHTASSIPTVQFVQSDSGSGSGSGSMSRSRSRSCFDHAAGHNPTLSPLSPPVNTTDDVHMSPSTSTPPSVSPSIRQSFPSPSAPQSRKDLGGALSLPPIMGAK